MLIQLSWGTLRKCTIYRLSTWFSLLQLYYRGKSLVSIRSVPPGKIKRRGTSNKYATNSGVSPSNVHTIAGVIHTTREVPESLGMLTELRQLPAILSPLWTCFLICSVAASSSLHSRCDDSKYFTWNIWLLIITIIILPESTILIYMKKWKVAKSLPLWPTDRNLLLLRVKSLSPQWTPSWRRSDRSLWSRLGRSPQGTVWGLSSRSAGLEMGLPWRRRTPKSWIYFVWNASASPRRR